MSERIVIIGAGQSGAQAVASLRGEGFTGPITMVGDEPFAVILADDVVDSKQGCMKQMIEAFTAGGLRREQIVIAGFSQGACLTTEFVATHPARWGGLIAFTGGLIGAAGETVSPAGDLGGTPALLLSGDPDPHVPWARVEESAAVLGAMGATVTLKKYPGRPHTVSRDELERARTLLLAARDHKVLQSSTR